MSSKVNVFKTKKKRRLPNVDEVSEHLPIKNASDETDESDEEEEKDSKHHSVEIVNQSHNKMSSSQTQINSERRSSNHWKYGTDTSSYSTRLIQRESGSHPNIIVRGHIHSYLYLYHSIIDTPWIKLFFYGFLLFFSFNLFFGTIFHLINGVAWNTSSEQVVTWNDAVMFALQTMVTIGFGALIPSNTSGNWLVFIMSYLSGIFWTAFTGIVFAKLSRPSRLKRQFKFSDVAVINHQMVYCTQM